MLPTPLYSVVCPPSPQALMHLASDAVRAAAESPFLDSALDTACGVLCSINLPPTAQQFDTGSGTAAVLHSMQASAVRVLGACQA